MNINKKILFTATLPILISSLTHAEYRLGNYDLKGKGTLGYSYTSSDIEKEGGRSSKWTEYVDRGRHIIGGAEVGTEMGSYFLKVKADHIALDESYYSIAGGDYSAFKYNFYYSSFVHNLTFGARTFYDMDTVGTGKLTYTVVDQPTSATAPPNYPSLLTDATQWHLFDYSIKNKTLGADGVYFKEGPYSAKLNVSQTKSDGIKPLGASMGLAPDWNTGAPSIAPYVELPEPVDYKVTNVSVVGSYKGENFVASMDGLFSNFHNGFKTLDFRVPDVTSKRVDSTFVLAPDNNMYKLSGQGVLHSLPFDSTLALKASYTKMTDSVELLRTLQYSKTGSPPTYPVTPINPDSENFKNGQAIFDGDVSYGVGDIVLASHPLTNFDTKLYYTYFRKWNNNTEVSWDWTPPTGAHRYARNRLNSHYKHKAGAELAYKLPYATKLTGGYELVNTTRTLGTAQFTKDHIMFLEAKNSMFDFITGKIKYTHMIRRRYEPDNLLGYLQNTPQAMSLQKASYTASYFRNYDTASKRSDAIKVDLDSNPLEDLDTSFYWAFTDTNYHESATGRQGESKQELGLSLSYLFPKDIKGTIYADYSLAKYHYKSRLFSANGSIDPYAEPSSGDSNTVYGFNYEDTFQEQNYAAGLNFDVPVTEKMTFNLGAQGQRGKGRVDFAQQGVINGGTFPANVPYSNIDTLDSYIKKTATAKLTYQFTTNLSANLAYIYENQKYESAQYDGYYNAVQSLTSPYAYSFLTGANNDQNYTAHMGTLMAQYTF